MRASRSLMLLTMLLLGLAAISVTAEDVDVTGSWTLTMTTPDGERSSALELVQNDEQLTVTLTGDRGESTGSGTIKGNEIEWSLTRRTPMGEKTFSYQGEVTGDTMAGETRMMNNVIPWQAVRAGSSAEAATEESAADDSEALEAMENLLIVEEVEPVPERLKPGFDSIDGGELHVNLTFLSSDSLQGRETGTLGHQIAAEYAATMFSLWGLQPAGDLPPRPSRRRMMMAPAAADETAERGYLQQIELKETVDSDGGVTVEWRRGKLYKARSFAKDIDYQYGARSSQVISAPLVFVGYGISETEIGFDEYAGIDTQGKIVMMLDGVPRKDDPDSQLSQEIKNKYDPPAMRRRSRFAPSERDKIAQNNGAVAIIMVESTPEKDGDVAGRVLNDEKTNDAKPIIPGERRRLSLIDTSSLRPFETLPTIRVSRQMADEILKLAGKENVESLKQRIEDDFKPQSTELAGISFTVESTVDERLLRSPNVLGYIEGSDPELKDEVVVVGAHLDHLGQRGEYIFNGADDNGSGSVAVLELAQAFALNPVKPKRSVLFALWTGEEKGLLGSRYYVLHPFFPIAKTVATLNLDMVSREWDRERLKFMSRRFGFNLSDAALEAVDVGKLMSYSFKDSDGEIRRAAQESNQYVGMMVFLREAENSMMTGGSDHAPFAMKEIPWAFIAAGMSEDFHEPSDSVEKTSQQLMEGITRLTYLTAFTLADS